MYLEHFDLSVNPFGLSPKQDFLYNSNAFAESMAHLIYGVDSGEALVMITGPIGTGKTTAIQSFLTNLGPHFATALVTNTRISGRELLKLVMDDLGVEVPPQADKSDLVIAFKRYLIEGRKPGRRVLIVVDEAQNLPAETLEEIRLLTNLGQGEQQPVQIILVGQPELEATVEQPELAQLRQRIRVHYRLDPLSRPELADYVRHRMTVAGCTRDDVFTREALDRIYEFSAGVPRVVNTLANDALLAAFVAGRPRVLGQDVEEPRMRTVAVAVPAPPPVEAPRFRLEPETSDSYEYGHRRGPARKAGSRLLRLLPIALILVATAIAAYYFLIYEPGAAGPNITRAPAGPAAVVAAPPVVPDLDQAAADGDTAAAAAAIADSSGRGTAGDEAAAGIEPVPAVSAATMPVPAEAWAVHVVSFRTEDRALTYMRDLARHASAAFHRFELVNGVGWYRVYVGPYPTRAAALEDARRMSEESGFTYFKIVRLDP